MADEELKEYAYDGKVDIVLRVKAASRAEADAKIRELLGQEQGIGIDWPNGVRGSGECINDMPLIFDDPDDQDDEEPDEEPDEKCRTCGEPNTNGEGYEGECGECADRRYVHDQGKHKAEPNPDCAACQNT
ncbi:hypothetical protein [Streptomyces werraensis]|uniref:hypothetical protein n=1 Tax=Streptomyces werraensis TaxID=68284 RepID=UPI0034373E63